jgi:hypothetical protein
MGQHSSPRLRPRKWFDRAPARLGGLGEHWRRTGFFQPLAESLTRRPKVRQYPPGQKVEMGFVRLLAGATASYHPGTTLRGDPALQAACGVPGWAEPSVRAETLDAATAAAVAALRQGVAASLVQYHQARRQDCARAVRVLDGARSPLPASKQAEGSTRGYRGRCRSQTGRKRVRGRAGQYPETVWDEVLSGNTGETFAVVPPAVAATERLLDGAGDSPEARAKRARIEFRRDSGWGSEEWINGLLERGSQVTGKFKATARVPKLVRPSTAGEPTASPGREVAPVPAPGALARPGAQYAVRTPSKDQPGGYSPAVRFPSRLDRGMPARGAHDDG